MRDIAMSILRRFVADGSRRESSPTFLRSAISNNKSSWNARVPRQQFVRAFSAMNANLGRYGKLADQLVRSPDSNPSTNRKQTPS